MEIVALAALALCGLLVFLLNRSRDHEVQAILDVMSAADTERAELLTRIQHPERVPPRHPVPAAEPREPRDLPELAKVGTITRADR